MQPAPGGNLRRFVGDRVRFTLQFPGNQPPPEGWRARLRTNLGRADVLRAEFLEAHARKLRPAGASWHDLPMRAEGNQWTLDLPLTQPGFFKAKAYLMDPAGWQHWPDGADLGISVHPDSYRTANTIYCAFTRMFGPSRTSKKTIDEKQEAQWTKLDKQDWTIIPPSGKFRDLVRQLPHIMDTLGCRILHLLPVNPTPTTYARMGRYGSPYAALDFTAIDPALVEFDRRTTGVDQFCELTYAVHLKGGRVVLDIATNHTGWGSLLQENHPEWFARGKDGTFASPGAWGTIWEDLVELEHRHVPLWDKLAEALLVWCRRGVDGFRCDAGYKVPLPAWQYLIARVHEEFPEALFLLEGLGGSWATTESLLTDGRMQWAYSELFQNYSGKEVAAYLDYAFKQSEQKGLFIHYSETHDNERLASRGRAWSLFRNRLCALSSVSGGFGFTCGVEWLAPERVNVHSSCGLAWDNPDNLVAELARLNKLLADHPCFFDSAKASRLSPPDSPIYALRRDSADGKDCVLILANNDVKASQKISLNADGLRGLGPLKHELLGQSLPAMKSAADGSVEFTLEPTTCYCLSAGPGPKGMKGEDYRRAHAQAAWASSALGLALPIEEIPAFDWLDLARIVDNDPAAFLAAISAGDTQRVRAALEHLRNPSANIAAQYPPVITWTRADQKRVLLVPPGHWLLLRDSTPFRATLNIADDPEQPAQHVASIPVRDGHLACFAPRQFAADAALTLERCAAENQRIETQLRFLAPQPSLNDGAGPLVITSFPALRDINGANNQQSPDANGSAAALDQPLVLLTNGIGGMARLCVDFGAIKSKYDCLLAANLNPRVPVDRHVFAKRARVWVNADGFITALDRRNLVSFQPGPPAIWRFLASAGDGRAVEIELTANMLAGRNTTVLRFVRPATTHSGVKPLPDNCDVRLTVRVDIEDRNFHWETKRNGGADNHFTTNSHPLNGQIGFAFTPAADRHLRVFSDSGAYHHEAEWSENIPHPVEQSRGQTDSGDAFSPGWFELPLARGSTVSLVACADDTDPSADEVRNALAVPGAPASEPADEFGNQLVRAAQAFVVRRDAGVTVIAGYPWFLDWGRDSLICARGLLAAGMTEQVKGLLLLFGRFEKDGTLPNTIHGDDASNRDTSDAPLWYGVVCEEAAAIRGAEFYRERVDANRTVSDVLLSIATHYAAGTPNGIRMDAASALVWSPAHFTWMDTNFPAGTPREGYPVEIQVLWIRLLRQLSGITPKNDAARWQSLAAQAEASFKKHFWLEDCGYLSDLLIAKPGQPASAAVADNALRSNCLFAVSLRLLTGEPAQRCVDAAQEYLVVPGALRSLAPLPVAPPLPIYSNDGRLLNDPPNPYWGRYEGDEDTRRKPAYHNGTAWTWTYPVFCEALARAWENSIEALAAARAYLGAMDRLMLRGCVGQIPEILDGDAPHAQRGCDAQAWGVTEALRVWKLLNAKPSN